MKPYRVADEDEQFVTYEFKTIYFYVLYVIFGLMLTGILSNTTWLSTAGFGLMLLYFLLVSIPYLPLHRKVRKAMREDSVQFSGSKWSFARPLKMRLRKDVPTTESNTTSG